MLKFKIYYGNGTTYSGNLLRHAAFAPQLNVQVIALESDNEQGYILIHGKDAYVYKDDGGWYGVNDMGFWDYMYNYKGYKVAVFGRTTARTKEFHDCVKRAMNEGIN